MDKLSEFVNQLPEVCEEYLIQSGNSMAVSTKILYARELNHFFDYLIYTSPDFCELNKKDISAANLQKVTSQDISRYITKQLNNGKSEKTVSRSRNTLSSFFTFLLEHKYIEFDPVKASAKVKVHTSDEVIYLTVQEQIDLLNAIKSGNTLTEKQRQCNDDKRRNRDYAIVLLLLDTGMRVSELQGINIGDINLKNNSILILRKGGNMQTVYFSDEANEAIIALTESLKKQGAISANTPLFQSDGQRISVRAIENMVKKYASATIKGKGRKISPHKLRSSFAMSFYESEKDILVLQRKLGHKSILSTNIYAKATNKKMQETRSVMENLRKRQSEE